MANRQIKALNQDYIVSYEIIGDGADIVFLHGWGAKKEIMKKASSPEVTASRKIRETAYWFRLLCAGLRTAVGMGVALIMLFSVSQSDFTTLRPSRETRTKISSSFNIGSGLNWISEQVGSHLYEHSQNISDNLNDLTNKIINGGK